MSSFSFVKLACSCIGRCHSLDTTAVDKHVIKSCPDVSDVGCMLNFLKQLIGVLIVQLRWVACLELHVLSPDKKSGCDFYLIYNKYLLTFISYVSYVNLSSLNSLWFFLVCVSFAVNFVLLWSVLCTLCDRTLSLINLTSMTEWSTQVLRLIHFTLYYTDFSSICYCSLYAVVGLSFHLSCLSFGLEGFISLLYFPNLIVSSGLLCPQCRYPLSSLSGSFYSWVIFEQKITVSSHKRMLREGALKVLHFPLQAVNGLDQTETDISIHWTYWKL